MEPTETQDSRTAASAPVMTQEASESPVPGPETRAINIFTKSAAWTGRLPSVDPNAPEVATRGQVKCKWMVNDLWIVGEIEDFFGTGADTRTWKALWVSGWDFGAKEYRGCIFDSYGTSSMMRGKREGQTLSFESMDDVMMRGQPTRLRFTFDASVPNGVKFIAEYRVNGAFVVFEEELHVPIAQ